MTVLELYSLDAGAGVALVTAQALHASPLVRIAHAAAAPVQIPREIVCAFNIHIDFFPVRVGALGGDSGADAVHPYSLDAQLLQLPLQVSLLSLKLVYLVNGFSVTIFKFLQIKGVVVGAHRLISKWVVTLHLPPWQGNVPVP